MSNSSLHLTLLGDVHGHMHAANAVLTQHARAHHTPDLILQVGDFEPHRHAEDLRSMDAPSKYKSLGDYADFHAGRARFDAPLYFIGGNHEPYAWLEQHPLGFSLTPEIHYLGRAGITRIQGLHVAYLSGIHVEDDFYKARPSLAQFDRISNKAWIGLNHLDLDAIVAQYTEPVDVLVLHDWPDGMLCEHDAHIFPARGRTRHGPPGNAYAQMLVELLEPGLVICGHMHTRYHRRMTHPSGKRCDLIALAHIKDHRRAVASCLFDPSSRTFDMISTAR